MPFPEILASQTELISPISICGATATRTVYRHVDRRPPQSHNSCAHLINPPTPELTEKLIRDLAALPEELRGGAVAIGNFDGVHRGHARIVERLIAKAREVGGLALVF